MGSEMCIRDRLDAQPAGAASTAHYYGDVPDGYWAQTAIVDLHDLGLMCGNDGQFRPEENTNRAQAITVMARLARMLEGGSG